MLPMLLLMTMFFNDYGVGNDDDGDFVVVDDYIENDIVYDKDDCDDDDVIIIFSYLHDVNLIHLWLRITDEGSVPKMRIWSISLI